jgi:hypothetical protein
MCPLSCARLSITYEKFVAVESFNLRLSSQYSLARVIPSFHFVKMCLCQVSLLSRCSPRYLTSWGSFALFILTGVHVSLRIVNMTWIDLDLLLAFILHFLNQFWIASRLVCSLCAAMARSLSVATTAVSLAKVGRYNNDS